MKSQLQLNVPKPCKEKFESFEPRPEGAFCGSCQTTVVDFSSYSDSEIQEFFAQATKKVCGRFKATQLKTYQLHRKPETSYWGLRAAVLTIPLLSVIPFTDVQAQVSNAVVSFEQDSTLREPEIEATKKEQVKGRIKDQNSGENIPFANVVVFGQNRGAVSDINGFFTLDSIALGDVIEFSFVGFKKQRLRVLSYEFLEVVLEEESLMGDVVIITGEVESREIYQRKRSFSDRLKNLFFD